MKKSRKVLFFGVIPILSVIITLGMGWITYAIVNTVTYNIEMEERVRNSPAYTSEYIEAEGYRIVSPDGKTYLQKHDPWVLCVPPSADNRQLAGFADGDRNFRIYKYTQGDPQGIYLLCEYEKPRKTDSFVCCLETFDYPKPTEEYIDAAGVIEQDDWIYRVTADADVLKLIYDILSRDPVPADTFDVIVRSSVNGANDVIYAESLSEIMFFELDYESPLYTSFVFKEFDGKYYLNDKQWTRCYEITRSEMEEILSGIIKTGASFKEPSDIKKGQL